MLVEWILQLSILLRKIEERRVNVENAIEKKIYKFITAWLTIYLGNIVTISLMEIKLISSIFYGLFYSFILIFIILHVSNNLPDVIKTNSQIVISYFDVEPLKYITYRNLPDYQIISVNVNIVKKSRIMKANILLFAKLK